MEIRLDGEVAIVTGAAGGIGRGVAAEMARSGARVALLDRSPGGVASAADEIKSSGGQASAHVADVADPAQVAAAVEQAAALHGDATILVTAAAIDESTGIEAMSLEQWHAMIDVNLNGTFYCLKAVLPGMRRASRGRIILFGSNIGLKGGAEIAHYGAAKAAVHGLARCAAIDLAPAGITVNVIAPGPVETGMLWSLPAEWLDAKKSELPLHRFGTVQEIVPTVVLLASAAGAFYTGSVINISGGDVIM
jgi:3-oxoacyl-[acyl-carrier protein] reductase